MCKANEVDWPVQHLCYFIVFRVVQTLVSEFFIFPDTAKQVSFCSPNQQMQTLNDPILKCHRLNMAMKPVMCMNILISSLSKYSCLNTLLEKVALGQF